MPLKIRYDPGNPVKMDCGLLQPRRMEQELDQAAQKDIELLMAPSASLASSSERGLLQRMKPLITLLLGSWLFIGSLRLQHHQLEQPTTLDLDMDPLDADRRLPQGSIMATTPSPIPASQQQQQQAFKYMTYADIDADKKQRGYNVTFTSRGFEIDGRASLLLGGSIHYPRSTPQMWDDLFLKARNDGLNHIQMYVFWNLHEPQRDIFNFHERANLTHFLERAAFHGLFVHVRFGPYVCGEWANGGLPVWLNTIPGIQMRSSNAVWKREMYRFVQLFVSITRPFFASNGGPIILAQIENEYNGHDSEYVQWCGQLVREFNLSIPWIMCNGQAADNTILACNGNDCVEFAVNQSHFRPSEPFVWTEDEGWYQKWEAQSGDQDDDRTSVDVAYSIARWFAIGGAHHNYYMYHGGNNYGRAASANVATKYADNVNLHADGLANEPKRSHLRKLHLTLIECNDMLLAHDRQIHRAIPLPVVDETRTKQLRLRLNNATRAFEYGQQVVFLENSASHDFRVAYKSKSYYLPRRSVVILKQNQIIFNTSDTNSSFPHKAIRLYKTLDNATTLRWKYWQEPYNGISNRTFRRRIVSKTPIEQLRVTNDETDYMIYETNFSLSHDQLVLEPKHWRLTWQSCDANAFVVLLNDHFVGEATSALDGGKCHHQLEIKGDYLVMSASTSNNLKIISIALGINSLGLNHKKGIVGDIQVNGRSIREGDGNWFMYPSLVGEQLRVYDPEWIDSVDWRPLPPKDQMKSLFRWYSTRFNVTKLPLDDAASPVEQVDSILLDCRGLSRGRVFINGHDIGRFWLKKNHRSSDEEFVQRYYHLPKEWLKHKNNLIVVVDEMGGTVDQVGVVTSMIVIIPKESDSSESIGYAKIQVE